MDKKIINICAKTWSSKLNIYNDLLKAVNAPEWHGESVDALIDSFIYGGINGVEPPYVIRFHGTDGLPNDIVDELRVVKDSIAQARLERQKATGVDIDIELEIV